MCAGCKKIRDDQGRWRDVAVYLLEHTGTTVSHGLCPDCLRERYPEFSESRP
ncbi:MAG: hypothetical protein ACYDA8_08935 [Deferrisomatales bacterium]